MHVKQWDWLKLSFKFFGRHFLKIRGRNSFFRVNCFANKKSIHSSCCASLKKINSGIVDNSHRNKLWLVRVPIDVLELCVIIFYGWIIKKPSINCNINWNYAVLRTLMQIFKTWTFKMNWKRQLFSECEWCLWPVGWLLLWRYSYRRMMQKSEVQNRTMSTETTVARHIDFVGAWYNDFLCCCCCSSSSIGVWGIILWMLCVCTPQSLYCFLTRRCCRVVLSRDDVKLYWSPRHHHHHHSTSTILVLCMRCIELFQFYHSPFPLSSLPLSLCPSSSVALCTISFQHSVGCAQKNWASVNHTNIYADNSLMRF